MKIAHYNMDALPSISNGFPILDNEFDAGMDIGASARLASDDETATHRAAVFYEDEIDVMD